MGHVIFCILHFLAVMFGLIGLFITIPLHIIYAVVANNNKPVNKSTTRVCPYCAEIVLKEASVCKHCNKDLPEEVEEVISYDAFGNVIKDS